MRDRGHVVLRVTLTCFGIRALLALNLILRVLARCAGLLRRQPGNGCTQRFHCARPSAAASRRASARRAVADVREWTGGEARYTWHSTLSASSTGRRSLNRRASDTGMNAVPNPLPTRSAMAAKPAGTSYCVRG